MRKGLSLLITSLLVWATTGPGVAQQRRPPSYGQSEAAAIAVLSGQATRWHSTHNLNVSDGASVTSWADEKGGSSLTPPGTAPKWRTTNVEGEPGSVRISPTGKPVLHVEDGTTRKVTATINATQVNQVWEFVFCSDWVPGSGTFFKAYKASPAHELQLFSIASNQKFGWQANADGGAILFTGAGDVRMLTVVTIKFGATGSAATISFNGTDTQTVNLSASLADGMYDTWEIGGAGMTSKWSSAMQIVGSTTSDQDAARLAAYQTLFGVWGTANVKSEASANQGNFILKPIGAANGKVFLWNHGAGQNALEMCLQTPTYAAVARAFVRAGWYVGCSTAGFDNWGNQSGTTDYGNLYDHIKANYTTNSKLVFGAHSMGNLIGVGLPVNGSTAIKADLKGVINAGNGVYDLAAIYNGANTSFKSAICTAYGLTCSSCSTSNTATCADWSSKTSGYRPPDFSNTWANGLFVDVRRSSGDTLIDEATHPLALITKLSNGTAVVTGIQSTCDHGDSSCPGGAARMYAPAQWVTVANRMTQ